MIGAILHACAGPVLGAAAFKLRQTFAEAYGQARREWLAALPQIEDHECRWPPELRSDLPRARTRIR